MKHESDFIDIQKKEHIENLLSNILKNNSNLQIWQKESTLRVKTEGRIKKYDVCDSYIELEAGALDGFMDFEKDEIYFYSKFRKTIFKSKIIRKGKNKIRIEYPDLIKIEEARVAPRTRYGLRSYQTIDILIQDANKNQIAVTDLKLLDSSESGAGFLINKTMGKYLSIGSKFVTLKSTVEGVEKKGGIVRSLTRFQNSLTGEELFRVGVELF
ncbi:MAG: hypothetical protein BM556_18040 [Bacteriovorax sp. MedPE-SWde]|nr:MAG: hypothetical protein BM556_18040 [Bacteriovorax sp. MedPE-SWde]